MADGYETLETAVRREIKDLGGLLEGMGISPAVYEQITLSALVANPQIGECSVESVTRAVVKSVELGLLPNGKQAAILPRWNGKAKRMEASLQPMVHGRRDLARRATPGLAIHDDVVYHGEHFVYKKGLHPILEHEPSAGVDRLPENVQAAYAVAFLPGASMPEFTVLLRADIDRIMARSSAKRKDGTHFGPWVTDYAEMAKKTAVNQVCKRLPEVPGMPVTPPDMFGAELGDYVQDTRPALEPVNPEPVAKADADPKPRPKPKAKPRPKSRPKAKAAAKPRVQNEPQPTYDDDPVEAPF